MECPECGSILEWNEEEMLWVCPDCGSEYEADELD